MDYDKINKIDIDGNGNFVLQDCDGNNITINYNDPKELEELLSKANNELVSKIQILLKSIERDKSSSLTTSLKIILKKAQSFKFEIFIYSSILIVLSIIYYAISNVNINPSSKLSPFDAFKQLYSSIQLKADFIWIIFMIVFSYGLYKLILLQVINENNYKTIINLTSVIIGLTFGFIMFGWDRITNDIGKYVFFITFFVHYSITIFLNLWRLKKHKRIIIETLIFFELAVILFFWGTGSSWVSYAVLFSFGYGISLGMLTIILVKKTKQI